MRPLFKVPLITVPFVLPFSFHLWQKASILRKEEMGESEEGENIAGVGETETTSKPEEKSNSGGSSITGIGLGNIGQVFGSGSKTTTTKAPKTSPKHSSPPRGTIIFTGKPMEKIKTQMPGSEMGEKLPRIPISSLLDPEALKRGKGYSVGLNHAGYGKLEVFGGGSIFPLPYQQMAFRIWKLLDQRLFLTTQERRILPQLIMFTHPGTNRHITLWELLYLDLDLDENSEKRMVKDFFFTPKKRGDYYLRESGWNLKNWGERHRLLVPGRFRPRSSHDYEELHVTRSMAKIEGVPFAEIFLELLENKEGLFDNGEVFRLETQRTEWGEYGGKVWDFVRNTMGRDIWYKSERERKPLQEPLCWKFDNFLDELPSEDKGRETERVPCGGRKNGIYLENLREVFHFKKFLNISVFLPPPSLNGIEGRNNFTLPLPMDNWMRGLSPEVVGSPGTILLNYYSNYGTEATVEVENSYINDPSSFISKKFLTFLREQAPGFDIQKLRAKRRNLIWLFIKTSMLENFVGEMPFNGGLLNEDIFMDLTLQGKEQARRVLEKIKKIIKDNKAIIQKETATWNYEKQYPYIYAYSGSTKRSRYGGRGWNYYSKEFGEKVLKPWEKALKEFEIKII